MKCEHCQNRILQKTGNTIRARIKGELLFEDGKCHTKCYWCGENITIPVEISKNDPILRERFVIRDVTNGAPFQEKSTEKKDIP